MNGDKIKTETKEDRRNTKQAIDDLIKENRKLPLLF